MSPKLLVANNRFFPSGGPERYLFNLLPELPGIGFDPVLLALQSNRNVETVCAGQFVPHPVDADFVLYSDRKLRVWEKARLAATVAYDGHLRKRIRRWIRESEIKLAYGLQIAHYLYPEFVLAAADCDVPTVLRMSDFQLICPAYSMFRDNRPCERCLEGIHHGIRHRCLKGSFTVSAARVAAMWIHRMLQVTDLVSAFACPSKFMADKLAASGIDEKRLVCLPTPISPSLEQIEPSPIPEKGYALYVGGLYDYKGPQVAVRAACKHGFDLVIAGSTDTPLGKDLAQEVEKSGSAAIRFAGYADGGKLETLYREASCVVVPSLWYENSPNVVLEAMAHGRPVVASNLGSLPEDVIDGETGLCFPAGDETALADHVRSLISDRAFAEELGRAGRRKVLAGHSTKGHLESLKSLFGRLL